MSTSTPNLFAHATSELSQDAFLCWLLEWADKSYRDSHPALNAVAVDLVDALFEAAAVDLPHESFEIDVERQMDGLDVLVLVGSDYALAIEDKVETSSHSNQLTRYREALSEEYANRDLALVYLKTGDQASYRRVREKGWATFTREDLLGVLRKGSAEVDNAIFEDFLMHLEGIEASVRRFETVPIDQWGPRDDAYKGFFMALQEELGEGSWSYVPNQRGGFMAFYWGKFRVDGGYIYLQLEEEELTVRIKVPDPESQSKLRNHWSRRVLDGIQSFDLQRPSRFGKGRTMTIAEHGDYRVVGSDGLLDLEQTANRLREAQTKLEHLVSASS